MPTGFVKKLADKKGMSVAEAEKKWEEAKSNVDKSKYPDDNAYYAVITKVFKSMMGETMVLSFNEWYKKCDTSSTKQKTV